MCILFSQTICFTVNLYLLSILLSRGLLAKPGASTRAGPFTWTRSWWARWRCPTRSPSTRTRGRPCASTARGSSGDCSGRAYSAKVSTGPRSPFQDVQCDAEYDKLIRKHGIWSEWKVFSFFSDCKFNCHKRCAYKVPNDCLGETIGGEGKHESVTSTVCLWLF